MTTESAAGTATMTTGSARPVPDVISIRLPAHSAYLSVLRTTTASLAARLDFTIDDIEDLKIAVDEACAMILGDAVDGTALNCEFELVGTTMRISVSALSRDGRVPPRDTFAWTVLAALVTEVDSCVEPDGRLRITMERRQEARDDL
jgi:serine/threonine-protein kinase RsbW